MRNDTFRSVGAEVDKQITLKSKVPVELQDIIMDLITSPDILMYDPNGDDEQSKWQRLGFAGSNEAVINTIDRVYPVEITFSLNSIINRDL